MESERLSGLLPVSATTDTHRIEVDVAGHGRSDLAEHLVVLRLTLWRREMGAWRVLDIREEEVPVIAPDSVQGERLDALLLGWAMAVEEMLPRVDPFVYPRALCFPSVSLLETPQTVEAYYAHFMMYSRLGRLAQH